MASGQFAREVFKTTLISHAPSEIGDDSNCEGVAANAGEVFTEQVGGPTGVASGRGADYFDVMAFPIHLAAAGRTRVCVGQSVEIGDRHREVRIGLDGETERRHRVRGVSGLLRLAIETGGLESGCDHPTVILHRGPGRGRCATAVGGLCWIARHDCQVGPLD
jgi:hypothetical protein